MRVGIVGLGRMGSAIVAALVGSGADVTAWSRGSTAALGEGPGTFAQVTSLGELADGADLILLSLSDGNALDDLLGSESSLLSRLTPGAVVADMSTVGESAAMRAARRVEAVGGRYVDAPVSGSVASIQNCELVVMASGRAEDVNMCRPAWAPFTKAVLHVGPVGAGQALKVALNGALHAFNAAVSEALIVAERKGIERAVAYRAFELSALGAPFLTYKRSTFLDPHAAQVAFALDLVKKDLELARSAARDVGTSSGQCDAAAGLVSSAVAAGLGDRDMAYLAEFLRGGHP